MYVYSLYILLSTLAPQTQLHSILSSRAHSGSSIYTYSICTCLATTNTEAFAAPNVEQATISGITTDPASPIVLYPNG